MQLIQLFVHLSHQILYYIDLTRDFNYIPLDIDFTGISLKFKFFHNLTRFMHIEITKYDLFSINGYFNFRRIIFIRKYLMITGAGKLLIINKIKISTKSRIF